MSNTSKTKESTIDAKVFYNGDEWRILGVGTEDSTKGTLLHLASTSRGNRQRNGLTPVQACVWSDADGVVVL